jgi:signal transduction histidine kinase
VQRAQTLIAGLLEFARAGKLEEVRAATDVAAVAGEVLADCESTPIAAGVSLALERDGAPHHALANRGVVTSILTNLVHNALKYLGDQPAKQITVRVARVDGRVHVEVRDTGPGIPAALQPRVFDLYVRGARDGAGLGLGLATVRRLVEAHQGRVGLVSSPAGSTFWFELPAAPAPAPPAPPSA